MKRQALRPVRRLILVVLAVVFLSALTARPGAAQDTATDPLADPVVRGAWLYEGNCVRCHQEYAEARLGEDATAKELKAKISGEDRRGCNVTWGKARGGPLTVSDINQLVDYMMAWEASGAALVLPPLPPQPTKTPTPAPTDVAEGADPTRTPTPTPAPLDPALQAAIDGDPVAHGAWLYARHCVVCHSDYRTGRMGRLLTPDEVERTIKDGKTGTSMVGFGPRAGNTLRSREIAAVVQYIFAWEEEGEQPALPAPVVAVLDLAIATNPTPTPTTALVALVPPNGPQRTANTAQRSVTEFQMTMIPWMMMGLVAVMVGAVLFWEMHDDA